MINLKAMALFKTDSNLIGLDIGSSGIRLVQVRKSSTGSQLVTYGWVPMEAKVMASDSQVDRQSVVEAIKKLVSESRVTTRSVVSGLPSAKVFSALISLPKMAPTELEKGIRYQAEQHVPMALDKVKLDWMLAGESADGKQQEVLIVAVPIGLSERTLGTLEAAGLEVSALEPDAIALARALVKPQESGAVTVLDVGETATDLVTVTGQSPKMIRSIPVGGNNFVKAAAQGLNLEPDQAYQFVYKFGLAQKMESQVRKAIKSSVDTLMSEIDKSTKFFEGHYKGTKIAKIILTGRAGMMPEFPAHLANSVGLPVEIGDAWAKISSRSGISGQLAELSNQFAVACGLALRER